jgi:hypothetical protein
MMQAVSLRCPNCGASVAATVDQRSAVCLYCHSHLRVVGSAPPANAASAAAAAPDAPSLRTDDQVPADLVDRVEKLVLAGKYDEAIRIYSEQANISLADAATLVNVITERIPVFSQLLRRYPIPGRAIALTTTVVVAAAAGAALLLPWLVRGSIGLGLLGALCALIAVLQLAWLVPRLIATWVFAHGSEGRGRVLWSTAIQQNAVKGGTVLLVHFEVRPSSGQQPFECEQALIVVDSALPKLQSGNVVRVRYRATRTYAFPTSPVEVLDRLPTAEPEPIADAELHQ